MPRRPTVRDDDLECDLDGSALGEAVVSLPTRTLAPRVPRQGRRWVRIDLEEVQRLLLEGRTLTEVARITGHDRPNLSRAWSRAGKPDLRPFANARRTKP